MQNKIQIFFLLFRSHISVFLAFRWFLLRCVVLSEIVTSTRTTNIRVIRPRRVQLREVFRRAYKWGNLYSEELIDRMKKAFQNKLHSSADQNHSRLFEFARFCKLQNVVKKNFISIQARKGLISWGLVTGCIFLSTGRWAYNQGQGGRWGGVGASKHILTVFPTTLLLMLIKESSVFFFNCAL